MQKLSELYRSKTLEYIVLAGLFIMAVIGIDLIIIIGIGFLFIMSAILVDWKVADTENRVKIRQKFITYLIFFIILFAIVILFAP